MTSPSAADGDRPEETGADRPSSPQAPSPQHQAGDPVAVDPATVRRAPRFARFVLTGIGLGALLSLVLVLLPLGSSDLGAGTLFLLLLLALGFAGGLLGAVVALAVDRRSLRRRPGSH